VACPGKNLRIVVFQERYRPRHDRGEEG